MTTTINASTSAGLVQTADTSGSLALQTANTTAVTIDTSQNVGIGTTSPASRLQVSVSSGTLYQYITNTGLGDAGVRMQSSTTADYAIFADSVNALRFYDFKAVAERMRIDSSGNVGIGTSTTTYKLNVVGTNTSGDTGTILVTSPSTDGTQFRINNTGTGGHSYTFYSTGSGNGPGAGALGIYDQTAGAYRAVIDSSGNLCINSTSVVGAEKLGVKFDGSTINGIGVQTTASSSGDGFVVFRNSAGTAIGTISRVSTTNAVAYNTTSDQRLKSNIENAEPVLDKLMQVQVRQYDWTEGSTHQDYGFIAQELEPTLSGLVTKGKTEEDMWQLDYAKLTPHLVKAIQELKAINDQQAETINALTARVVALESK